MICDDVVHLECTIVSDIWLAMIGRCDVIHLEWMTLGS